MTASTSKRRIQVAAGIALVALSAAACGGSSGSKSSGGSSDSGANKASAPGVTATTVTIGSHQPLTGPAAPGYSEIAPSSDAMFKYINSQGGVNGRTITYKYKDDGYNPANTDTVVKSLVLQDNVFAVFNGLGTPTHSKVIDFLNTKRVPDLFVASGAQLWDQPKKNPYTFGWQPDYYIEGKILGKYIKENFPGKKIGYFYQDDDFGQDGVKGLDTQLDPASVVDKEPYQTSQLAAKGGIAPAILKLKAKGAQVVVSFTIPAATAVEMLTNFAVGFKPQLAVTNVGSDPTTLAGLLGKFSAGKAGADLLNGIVTDSYLPALNDTADPWTALFKKVHDQYVPNLPFDGNVEYGMAAAYTFAQALKAAGKNPTRQSLIDAVEAGGFKGPGLAPFRFSKDSHAGYTGVRIGVLDGKGGVTFKGDTQTTDDAKGDITAYTESQANPADGGILKP
jgi:ABC-type branched-subunit amino acid transport system substrate-binding protein